MKIIKNEIAELLAAELGALRKKAQAARTAVGNSVFLRAIIETGNTCRKDCLYCGIRKSNSSITRYELSEKEIESLSLRAFKAGYKSIVLQSGENQSEEFIEKTERIIKSIKKLTDNNMRIVLSFGEQKEQAYKIWRKAGADRYLLRIETSSPSLYKNIHPNDGRHIFEERVKCLRILKSLGYQTGTGIIIGLPNQSLQDLANDVVFFKEMDIDMLGMGPYIPTLNTPLYEMASDIDIQANYLLTLKMIALCRIYMPDINIASTTALEAINPNGKTEGVLYGANVIMPNITPAKYRSNYAIYTNKPLANGMDKDYLTTLERELRKHNFTLDKNSYGDPLHYLRR